MTKIYHLKNGMMVEAEERCCLFCDNCTDIFFDYGGIYALVCKVDGNIDAGTDGKCDLFVEES